jgi:hypothetical protein
MGETTQRHDEVTTSEPAKVIKQVKKLKVSKHNAGTADGSGAVEGALLLIFTLSLHFVCSFDAKSSILLFLFRLVCLMAIYCFYFIADALTFFCSGDSGPSLHSVNHCRYDNSHLFASFRYCKNVCVTFN